jgi:hypothetical protein
MRKLGRLAVPVLAFAVGGGVPAASQQERQVNPQAKIIQDFQSRVKDYQKLRDSATKDVRKPKETTDPAEITAAQHAAAERIRAARRHAKQGEIFTPEISRHIRALMEPQVEGPRGAETKGAIKDVQPAAVRLKVNERYPDDEPMPMVPPNVLASLPRLPEGFEYRVVRDALILLDKEANLIVDFIPNVMS